MTYPYQLTSFDAYKEAYKKSIEDPAAFWSDVANHFTWRKKWDTALEWNFKEPKVEWFKGGKLNITENRLDRHIPTKGHLPALIWEPNAPDEAGRVLTYSKLLEKVCQFAQVLKNNGVQRGDRVCIYMGMIPELAIAVLACARIGAIHSVVFGGFSAQSIADRLLDANATFIVTCDGAFRGAKDIPLKSVIDDALIGNKTVKRVIVATRTRTPVSMIKGRDLWWEDEMKQVEEKGITFIEAEEMDAEDPLFILYTSGSTGKPKGVVHTCGGYMVFTNYTFVNVFQYKPGQIHFCTADIGWITGHSYIVYGPLSAGATTLLFEGIPTWPDAGRFWDVVDKYKVNILHIQNGESSAGIFDQTVSLNDSKDLLKHNVEYTQRSITNILLSGTHTFYNESEWKLNWKISPSISSIKDKDIRTTSFEINDEGKYLIPLNGKPSRIWRNLDETNIVSKVDLQKKLKLFNRDAKLKFGALNSYKEREYDIKLYK